MAGATTDARLPRCPTQDTRRIERHIPERYQIRFASSDRFGMKHLSRVVEGIFVQLSSRWQSRLFAADWKGKGVLKNHDCRKTRRNQRAHSNDHPLAAIFSKRQVAAGEEPSI
jgi:hypothetical protein